MNKRAFLWIVIGVVALALIIQLIPYGRNHTNPAVISEPKWDSQQTRDLAKRACFDCHSNESVWPWYSNIAPVSWLVYSDVMEGRRRMNFSEWNRPQPSAAEAGEIVLEREMPPAIYLPLHPNARLTATERQNLATGLNTSLK